MDEGLFDVFLDAGAAISHADLRACLGGHMGILAAGERAVATTNRNFVGRMGAPDERGLPGQPGHRRRHGGRRAHRADARTTARRLGTDVEESTMRFEGTTHRYGRDVDTDVIIPARYLNTSRPRGARGALHGGHRRGFVAKVQPGDILVAEENFGCGSSREHAPIAIKAGGVSVVIAASFARIFYRNAINTGLPIMESPEAAAGIRDGDRVEVDVDTGTIEDLTTGESWQAQPFPSPSSRSSSRAA